MATDAKKKAEIIDDLYNNITSVIKIKVTNEKKRKKITYVLANKFSLASSSMKHEGRKSNILMGYYIGQIQNYFGGLMEKNIISKDVEIWFKTLLNLFVHEIWDDLNKTMQRMQKKYDYKLKD